MNELLEPQVTLIDAIFHRRAVREYSRQPVGEDTVGKLLAAAVQAPSAMNQQPWAFAVIHGGKRLRDYSEAAKLHLVRTYPPTFELHSRIELYENSGYDLFHGADTVIVIYAASGRLQPNEDCCLAAENLMLAAYGLGLGTCPIGFARPWFELPETKRMLGVPEHYHAVFPLVVGYPAGFTSPPPREEPNVLSWQWDHDGAEGLASH
jgi:nitroreductase